MALQAWQAAGARMDSVSNKALWTLICSGGLQTEPGIVRAELLNQALLLSEGLASYKPNSKQSREKFKADKSVSESWREFVCKLADVLGVEESKSWTLLCSYLATEFRGTAESLLQLLEHEGQVGSGSRPTVCTFLFIVCMTGCTSTYRCAPCWRTFGSSTGQSASTCCR